MWLPDSRPFLVNPRLLVTETQTVDLAAWLTRIWDEEERLAKAAASGYSGASWEMSLDVIGAGGRGYVAVGPYGGDIDSDIGTHIACHDPASVLARIAADRKILELHKIEVRKVDTPPFDELTGERWPDTYDVTCAICGWAAEDPTSACSTVRLLASPYKGREGWQEAWDE
jgi:hypothetical protein